MFFAVVFSASCTVRLQLAFSRQDFVTEQLTQNSLIAYLYEPLHFARCPFFKGFFLLHLYALFVAAGYNAFLLFGV